MQQIANTHCVCVNHVLIKRGRQSLQSQCWGGVAVSSEVPTRGLRRQREREKDENRSIPQCIASIHYPNSCFSPASSLCSVLLSARLSLSPPTDRQTRRMSVPCVRDCISICIPSIFSFHYFIHMQRFPPPFHVMRGKCDVFGGDMHTGGERERKMGKKEERGERDH